MGLMQRRARWLAAAAVLLIVFLAAGRLQAGVLAQDEAERAEPASTTNGFPTAVRRRMLLGLSAGADDSAAAGVDGHVRRKAFDGRFRTKTSHLSNLRLPLPLGRRELLSPEIVLPTLLQERRTHRGLRLLPFFHTATSYHLSRRRDGGGLESSHSAGEDVDRGGPAGSHSESLLSAGLLQDIAVVTHMSLSKQSQLLRLLAHWDGIISLSVHIRDFSHDIAEVSKMLSDNPAIAERVDIHLVAEGPDYVAPGMYPFNTMRALALDGARTELVFVLDIDFLPSFGARSKLRAWAQQPPWSRRLYQWPPLVLVVPAFERMAEPVVGKVSGSHSKKAVDNPDEVQLPASKAGLRKAMEEDRVIFPFHMYFARGHMEVNYSRWFNTNEPYAMKANGGFEPYVVGHKMALARVRYDEDFVGYGRNKISWFVSLRHLHSTFAVCPDAWLVHINHEYKKSRSKERAFNSDRPMRIILLDTRNGDEIVVVHDLIRFLTGIKRGEDIRLPDFDDMPRIAHTSS